MNRSRVLWTQAGFGCSAASLVVLALRFSNPYIVALRSVGWVILVLVTTVLTAIAVMAFRESRRVPSHIASGLAPIVLSGLTIWSFGFVAFFVALLLVVLTFLCLLPARTVVSAGSS